MGTHRHNYRNECLQLRGLLKLSYKALRDARWPIPKELVTWMKAQREIKPIEDVPTRLTVEMIHKELVLEGFDGKDI